MSNNNPYHVGRSDSDSDLGSDSDSMEIDYPSESEVYWSDDDNDTSGFYSNRYYRNAIDGLLNTVTDQDIFNLLESPNPKKEQEKPKHPTRIVTVKNFVGDCAICLRSNDVVNNIYCSSECGNVFHKSCIAVYVNSTDPRVVKCPLCRTVSIFKTIHSVEKSSHPVRPNVMYKQQISENT